MARFPHLRLLRRWWKSRSRTTRQRIVSPYARKRFPKATVRFKDSKGGKLRIAFLSAMGKETETLWDTDVCTLSLGGIFHFNCYFTYPGANSEIKPKIGGTVGVMPPRP